MPKSQQDKILDDHQKHVIRLRGLPFGAGVDDVRTFFKPVKLLEVYICKRDGRAIGEAYVVVPSAADAKSCLAQLDRKYIGSRYIELFEATGADLRAVKKVLEDKSLQGFVVRLRGLPYTATQEDVESFLEGVQLADGSNSIVIIHSVNGTPTGEAFVELADEQALALAMTRHKEVLGNRYIEVFASSKVQKLQAMRLAESIASGRHNRRNKGSWGTASRSNGTAVFPSQQQQHGFGDPIAGSLTTYGSPSIHQGVPDPATAFASNAPGLMVVSMPMAVQPNVAAAGTQQAPATPGHPDAVQQVLHGPPPGVLAMQRGLGPATAVRPPMLVYAGPPVIMSQPPSSNNGSSSTAWLQPVPAGHSVGPGGGSAGSFLHHPSHINQPQWYSHPPMSYAVQRPVGPGVVLVCAPAGLPPHLPAQAPALPPSGAFGQMGSHVWPL